MSYVGINKLSTRQTRKKEQDLFKRFVIATVATCLVPFLIAWVASWYYAYDEVKTVVDVKLKYVEVIKVRKQTRHNVYFYVSYPQGSSTFEMNDFQYLEECPYHQVNKTKKVWLSKRTPKHGSRTPYWLLTGSKTFCSNESTE